MSEIATLSTLDPHRRIVAYLGASYRPHPIFKEDHLFILTEYMEGVGIMTFTMVDFGLPSYIKLYCPKFLLGEIFVNFTLLLFSSARYYGHLCLIREN